MAVYMVEVNNKFMVRLEIDGSLAAAEHYFLDRFKNVWGALAFDQKGMKTDTFIGSMLYDTLIELDDLEYELNKLLELDEETVNLANRIGDIDEEIVRLTSVRKQLNEEWLASSEKWNKQFKKLNAARPQ